MAAAASAASATSANSEPSTRRTGSIPGGPYSSQPQHQGDTNSVHTRAIVNFTYHFDHTVAAGLVQLLQTVQTHLAQ